jgi:hypothetical protein
MAPAGSGKNFRSGSHGGSEGHKWGRNEQCRCDLTLQAINLMACFGQPRPATATSHQVDRVKIQLSMSWIRQSASSSTSSRPHTPTNTCYKKISWYTGTNDFTFPEPRSSSVGLVVPSSTRSTRGLCGYRQPADHLSAEHTVGSLARPEPGDVAHTPHVTCACRAPARGRSLAWCWVLSRPRANFYVTRARSRRPAKPPRANWNHINAREFNVLAPPALIPIRGHHQLAHHRTLSPSSSKLMFAPNHDGLVLTLLPATLTNSRQRQEERKNSSRGEWLSGTPRVDTCLTLFCVHVDHVHIVLYICVSY